MRDEDVKRIRDVADIAHAQASWRGGGLIGETGEILLALAFGLAAEEGRALGPRRIDRRAHDLRRRRIRAHAMEENRFRPWSVE